MAEIHLDDVQHVVIDGEMVGDVVSAMSNYPDQKRAIQAALQAWQQGLTDQAVAALNDQVATLTQQLADMTTERDTANRDTANLKAKMMGYLADSDSGKALLLALELMQVEALLTALNAKKAEIEGMIGS